MNNSNSMAPGAPGDRGRWTSSAKSGIGKSLGCYSQVSFTIGNGMINEVYYPREDNACIRYMELLVAGENDFFSEEGRDTQHEITMTETGIPAYTIKNTCTQKIYSITKEIVTDPLRNTLLQKVKFTTLKGNKGDYRLYVLLTPHISNKSQGNAGFPGDYKGVPMLFAERDGITLALSCSSPWKKRSIGFAGISDGYTDISSHKNMEWEYEKAGPGNIVLTAEIDLGDNQEEFTLALSFGRDKNEAGQHARASLLKGFDACRKHYIKQWDDWHKVVRAGKPAAIHEGKLFHNSIAVMRMHESFHFSGAVIASLSIPWGNIKGDGDIGGYHVVWPRDLVECSGAFLAFNAQDDALRVMNYLMATQEMDGHWQQNMWLEGTPYMNGIQLDQTAFPILLICRCKKECGFTDQLKKTVWQTVKKAAIFLLKNGPVSPQDRWEEEEGISVFTLATCIAALLVAAELAEENQDQILAKYCREKADYWYSKIDDWLYVTATSTAREIGVEGYYIRVNPTGCPAEELQETTIAVKNRPENEKNVPVNELVSVDALALVRFGLRRADDPKILNTIKVIDARLKVETQYGPCWHRYNNDGYGEHADGSAFDGTGIGRVWPLLTGERAHYEIAAGNMKQAEALMKTMEDFSSHELFSEQVWDADDIPEKELFKGKHSGSAIPLVWAHSEYVKLCASISQKKVFDMPGHTVERYLKNKTKSKIDIWSFRLPIAKLTKGNTLRIETEAPATVHWSADNWATVNETDSKDTGFGVYFTDILAKSIQGENIVFTFFWKEPGAWENKDYTIKCDTIEKYELQS